MCVCVCVCVCVVYSLVVLQVPQLVLLSGCGLDSSPIVLEREGGRENINFFSIELIQHCTRSVH